MAGSLPLADVWLGLVVLLAVAYAVTDGADLGVGILCLFPLGEARRGELLAGVEGVWHANQTWLVILGGVLFGAFPLGYGTLLTALYVPVCLLLLGLMLRAVAFEFRGESRNKTLWSLGIGAGSALVTLAQGLAIGGFLGGMKVEAEQFAGGLWDWLNPLCAPAVLGLSVGYTLLGAAWSFAKVGEGLRGWCARVVRTASVVGVLIVGLLWGTASGDRPAWPLVAAALLVVGFRSTGFAGSRRPFLWSALAMSSAVGGLALGLYPILIPPSVTASAAAAPQATLWAMLVVLGLLIPVLFAYNAYQFWVFRGPVGRGGYGGDASDEESSGGE